MTTYNKTLQALMTTYNKTLQVLMTTYNKTLQVKIPNHVSLCSLSRRVNGSWIYLLVEI